MFKEVEKNLPFLASILLGLLVELINILYVGQFVLHVAALVAIFLALTRFDAWVVLGAVLLALTFEARRRGDADTFWLLLIMLGVGTLLNYLAYLFRAHRLNERLPKPMVIQNVALALAGIGGAMFLQFRACGFAMASQFDNPILQANFGLMFCRAEDFNDIFNKVLENEPNDPEIYVLLLTLVGKTLIISPQVWALIAAAISASWFRVWMVGKILRRIVTGLLAASILGFLSFLWIIASIALEATIIPQSHPYWESMLVVWVAIDFLTLAIGAGWGASWGSE